MPDVIDRLRLDHRRMAAVLTALRSAVRRDPGDIPVDHVMCMLDYISEYPDKIHHPLEDELFGRMLSATEDPEIHKRVHDNAAARENLAAQTRALVSDVDALGEDLNQLPKAAIETYIEAQFEHMNYEEAYIFAAAEVLLSAEDWQRFDAHYADSLDPAFEAASERYAAIFDYVAPNHIYGVEPVRAPRVPVPVPQGFNPMAMFLEGLPGAQNQLWPTAAELGEIAAEQHRLLISDLLQSAGEISRGNLFWGIDHVRRRATHVAEGWRRSNAVALGAMERLQAPR